MSSILWREGDGEWCPPIVLMEWGEGVEGEKATRSGRGGKGRWVTVRGRRVFIRKGGARSGMASVVKEPTKEQVEGWRGQIDGWDGPRRGVAGDALYSIEADEHQALVIEDRGELKAIAAFQEPYFVEGLMGPRKVGHSVVVPYLATRERGYGLRLMQELAQRAAEDGGLRFNATSKSRGFYEAIGMGEYAQGGNLFNLTFEQARTWLETSGQKAKDRPKRKVPEWLAESFEPEDGVFIVKPEREKARGRWVTLPDGRHVRIAKPRPTLASQVPGARPASEIVSNAPDRLQRILDRASYVPTEFGGRLAGTTAGTAAQKLGDGSYTIPVRKSGRPPSRSILIHEAVHGHQSELSIPRRDTIEKRFEGVAREDNRTAKSPLWGDDMLWQGGEVWATATGWYYGGARSMLEESSPQVARLVREVYGKSTGEKARGRGGKYGRWRTLKNGKRVFISGGTPIGGLSVAHGRGRTLFDTFGDVDSERVDRLIHDFEGMPNWATEDIGNIEIYERPGARFTAGGETFQTGMDYNHSMGRIRIFQANEELSEMFTNEGLYHEVGHNLDRRWRDAAMDEQGASFRDHRDWYSRGGVFNERHRSDFNDAYPMAAARRQWEMSWAVGEDGISSYSKAWAREDNSGETVAEFARFYFGGYGRGGAKMSRRNVSVIGDEKGAPNLARAFADAMEGLSKERR